MTVFNLHQILFETTLAPAGRQRLALFSEGTEDPNPIHIDDDFAHGAGFPTVLQQGPMTTAQFARLLEDCAGRGKLRMLDVQFLAPVFPDDQLTLRADVTSIDQVICCNLVATKQDGTQTAKGTAELLK